MAGKPALEATGDEVRVFVASYQFFDYPRGEMIAGPRDDPWNDLAVDAAYEWADLVVIHREPSLYAKVDKGRGKPVIVHHHGTYFRKNPSPVWAEGEAIGALQVVSTVDLLLSVPKGKRAYWLPHVIDVDRMQAIRLAYRQRPGPKMRISHAPTARQVKGTHYVTKAARKLHDVIEYRLISRKPWQQCLALKASTDLFVDQMFLGYGANAVEAWAMGLPVIASASQDILNRMRAEYPLPFYATTLTTLQDDLHAFLDPSLREEWADRGMAHVQRFHTHAAFAKRFHELAEMAIDERELAA